LWKEKLKKVNFKKKSTLTEPLKNKNEKPSG